MYVDKEKQESFQQKLDSMMELLVERGRRCHQNLSDLEREELCGYLLILQPEKDQYNYLIEGDEDSVMIPYFMSKYLIDSTQDNKDLLLAAIRRSTKEMFKDVIDKMFSDYPCPLTNDHILELQEREFDKYKEL